MICEKCGHHNSEEDEEEDIQYSDKEISELTWFLNTPNGLRNFKGDIEKLKFRARERYIVK